MKKIYEKWGVITLGLGLLYIYMIYLLFSNMTCIYDEFHSNSGPIGIFPSYVGLYINLCIFSDFNELLRKNLMLVIFIILLISAAAYAVFKTLNETTLSKVLTALLIIVECISIFMLVCAMQLTYMANYHHLSSRCVNSSYMNFYLIIPICIISTISLCMKIFGLKVKKPKD